MAAYLAAIEDARGAIGERRNAPGSVAALVASYYTSSAFGTLARKTRRERRYVLERIRCDHGGKRVATLQKQHVDALIAAKLATPSAADSLRKALIVLLDHAVLLGWRVDNPARLVKLRRPPKNEGFRAWSEDDIARFEAFHPVGTRSRLALALGLFTAQRRGDVIGLGPQHVRHGVVSLRQSKTGAALIIPVHLELAEVLAATPTDHLTFLTTKGGRPFTPTAFTNWFGQACRDAGLPPGLSFHGLRKAAARRLAEAGASASQISAVTGHASLREVERYTAAADQARLAQAAMDTVAAAFPRRSKAD